MKGGHRDSVAPGTAPTTRGAPQALLLAQRGGGA